MRLQQQENPKTHDTLDSGEVRCVGCLVVFFVIRAQPLE